MTNVLPYDYYAYEDFGALVKDYPTLGKHLLNTYHAGNWQNEPLTVFPTQTDWAKYEVLEDRYSLVFNMQSDLADVDFDLYNLPSLWEFINYAKLAKVMHEKTPLDEYFDKNGQVVISDNQFFN